MEKTKIEKNEKRQQILDAMMRGKSLDEFGRTLEIFSGIVNSLADFKRQKDSLQALQDVHRRLADYIAQGLPVIDSIIPPLHSIKKVIHETELRLTREGKTSEAALARVYRKECSQMLSMLHKVEVFDISLFRYKK